MSFPGIRRLYPTITFSVVSFEIFFWNDTVCMHTLALLYACVSVCTRVRACVCVCASVCVRVCVCISALSQQLGTTNVEEKSILFKQQPSIIWTSDRHHISYAYLPHVKPMDCQPNEA